MAPVAPEVRVTTNQVLSLGDDRLVLAADLNVEITRAGIFSLSFALPEGLEVEALTGAALSQWTEDDEAGSRVITMHLTGRTIGDADIRADAVRRGAARAAGVDRAAARDPRGHAAERGDRARAGAGHPVARGDAGRTSRRSIRRTGDGPG